jgi:hypothetical protein
MSNNSIPQTFEQRRRAAFAVMASQMIVSVTSNPRRYVDHPSGWRFIAVGNVVEGGCFGPVVLAAAPGYALSAACHLADGPAAVRVLELLEVA